MSRPIVWLGFNLPGGWITGDELNPNRVPLTGRAAALPKRPMQAPNWIVVGAVAWLHSLLFPGARWKLGYFTTIENRWSRTQPKRPSGWVLRRRERQPRSGAFSRRARRTARWHIRRR